MYMRCLCQCRKQWHLMCTDIYLIVLHKGYWVILIILILIDHVPLFSEWTYYGKHANFMLCNYNEIASQKAQIMKSGSCQ